MKTDRSVLLVCAAVVALGVLGCGGGDPGPSGTDSGFGGSDSGPVGVDSGMPECGGVATDCSLVSTLTCTTQDGCRLGGDCTGVSRSCSSYSSSATCNAQLGCSWSSSSSSCNGSAWTCTTTSAETNCRSIEGCTWQETCDGFSTSCFLLETQATCDAQQGCRWE